MNAPLLKNSIHGKEWENNAVTDACSCLLTADQPDKEGAAMLLQKKSLWT